MPIEIPYLQTPHLNFTSSRRPTPGDFLFPSPLPKPPILTPTLAAPWRHPRLPGPPLALMVSVMVLLVLAVATAGAGIWLLFAPGKRVLLFFSRLSPPRLRHRHVRAPRTYLRRLRLSGVFLLLATAAATLLSLI